jgi:hypothetical protein
MSNQFKAAMWKQLSATVALMTLLVSTPAQTNSRMKPNQTMPAGYWPLEKSQPIIEKTQTITLAPDLSQLSAGERSAVNKLLEVGKIFQEIYEDQRHHQALASYRSLQTLGRSFISPMPTMLYLSMLYR